MTKTLDTLVQDIYSTLEKGVDVSQPSVQEALDEVGSLVREATETVLREGERTGASNLRLSQIGKPDRQIWYGVQGEDGEPLNGQTRIKFLMGHVLEALLICLTKVSGHTVEEAQDTVEVEEAAEAAGLAAEAEVGARTEEEEAAEAEAMALLRAAAGAKVHAESEWEEAAASADAETAARAVVEAGMEEETVAEGPAAGAESGEGAEGAPSDPAQAPPDGDAPAPTGDESQLQVPRDLPRSPSALLIAKTEVTEDGTVLSPAGETVGRLRPDGLVESPNGLVLGRRMADGTVVEADGGFAEVLHDGTTVMADGTILGARGEPLGIRARADGMILTSEGEPYGCVAPDGSIRGLASAGVQGDGTPPRNRTLV